MKTKALNGTDFEQLKKDLSDTNEAAVQAQSEQVIADAPMSNPTGVAKRLKERVTKAQSGSPSLKAPKKRSVNNAGISENVYNGESMVDVLITLEPTFNPINPAHSIASLTAKNVAGREMLGEVRDTKLVKTLDGNARRVEFKILKKKFTRVFNQLMACGAPDGTVNNAKIILDLMRAKRRGKVKEGAKTHSISRQSFNQMIDHVSDFLVLLANCPEYGSNVPELTLEALETYRDALRVGNSKASKSKAEWNTSIVERNEFFNAQNTGYVATFQATKRSVKAQYGGDSPQYHQVAHFKFNRIYS